MKKDYYIDPRVESIPDRDLGDYIEGYTSGRVQFNYWMLLYLAPTFIFFLGWLFTGSEKLGGLIFMALLMIIPFVIYFNRYISEELKINRYLIYSKGFLWQRKNRKGVTKEECIIRFETVLGMKALKTTRYTNGVYNITTVEFKVLGYNKLNLFEKKISYKNKYEDPEKYNTDGYGMYAILNRWNIVAMERYNNEFHEKGYCTFYSGKDVVKLGKDFIMISEDYFEIGSFSYKFDEGVLWLNHNKDKGFKKKRDSGLIFVNEMYNNHVFIMMLDQLLGIN